MTSSTTIFDKRRLLCVFEKKQLFYYKGKVIIQDTNTSEEKSITLIKSLKERILVKSRLVERMLRLSPRFAVPIDEHKILISFKGAMYFLDLKTLKVSQQFVFRKGMNNPLSACIEGNEEYLALFGEYWGNTNKEKVGIFALTKELDWINVYCFPENTVTHIHNIIFDQCRKCYWILTGDSDSESGIWKSNLDFTLVKPLLIGKQIYRSCFLIPIKSGLIYATDTPLESNAVYFIDFDNNEVNSTKIFDMPGPCIYGKLINDEMIAFATSVEPDPSLSKWKYRLSNEVGPGVKNKYSHLVFGNLKNGFKIIRSDKKDLWNMWLFQFGNYQFPFDKSQNRLFFSPTALSKVDGKTLEIKFESNNI